MTAPEPTPRPLRKLLIVYAAASGWHNALRDSLLKLAGAGCDLCALTHGLRHKRAEIEALERDLGGRVVYLHTDDRDALDDLRRRRGGTLPLPSILVELDDGDPGTVELLLGPQEIRRLRRRRGSLREVVIERCEASGIAIGA